MSWAKDRVELRTFISEFKKVGRKSIGFVPTMGYLHEGHLSLIKKAREENEIVIVSVFVNPTQFGPSEDFESYPRDQERDYKMSIDSGADIVYFPTVDDIYPNGSSTIVEVEGDITKKLCGKSRPTHFKGVTTVVNKLFNIVKPDNAYFGQKDAQQVILIKKMVRDLLLDMDINIVICPIIRERDGLAKSSRNVYLNEEERRQSVVLSKSLNGAKELYNSGEKNVHIIKKYIEENINKAELAKIDYVEIVCAETLGDIETIENKALAAVAVRFGKTRLIDNIFIGGE